MLVVHVIRQQSDISTQTRYNFVGIVSKYHSVCRQLQLQSAGTGSCRRNRTQTHDTELNQPDYVLSRTHRAALDSSAIRALIYISVLAAAMHRRTSSRTCARAHAALSTGNRLYKRGRACDCAAHGWRADWRGPVGVAFRRGTGIVDRRQVHSIRTASVDFEWLSLTAPSVVCELTRSVGSYCAAATVAEAAMRLLNSISACTQLCLYSSHFPSLVVSCPLTDGVLSAMVSTTRLFTWKNCGYREPYV